MSSYLSHEYKIQQPQSSINIQLIDKTLSSLQGKYDANKAIIDQAHAQYKNQLKGLRDVDNEYIAAKFQELDSVINQQGLKNSNLGYNSNRDAILQTMGTLLEDPIIQNAVTSRAIAAKYDEDYSKLLEKKPELANNVNYAYGKYKGGYDDYMQGRTQKLSSMQYNPYTDYTKELAEVTKNLDKHYQVTKTSTPSGDGYMYIEEGKVLSAEKVKAMAESLLSSGAKQQMTIDGWGSYHQGNTEEERTINTKSAFTSFKNKIIDFEKQTLTLDKVRSSLSKDEIKEREKQIQEKTDYLNQIYNEGSASQMYGMMYKESILSNFSNAYAHKSVTQEVKEDIAYWEREKLSFNERKFLVEQDLAERKLKAEFGDPNAPSNIGVREAINDTPNISDEDLYDTKFQEIVNLENTLDSKLNSYIKNDAQKAEIETLVKNGYSKYEAVKKLDLIPTEDKKVMLDLHQEFNTETTRHSENRKEIMARVDTELNTPTFMSQLYNNSKIKVLDENGKSISAKNYLINKGILKQDGNKARDLTEDESNTIKKTMLADKFISNSAIINGVVDEKTLSSLASMFNETKKSVLNSEFIKVRDREGGFIDKIVYEYNPNSRTAKFLQNAKKNQVYDNSWSKDSFDDIYTNWFNLVDEKTIRREMGKRYADKKITTFAREVTISPKTPEYRQVARQVGLDVESTLPLTIKQQSGDRNMVDVWVGIEGKVGKYEKINVPIKWSDLPSNVIMKVELDRKKSIYNMDNFAPTKGKAEYKKIKDIDEYQIAQEYYGGTTKEDFSRAKLLTNEGLKSALESTYKTVYDKNADLKNTIEKAIDSNRLEVRLEKRGSKGKEVVVTNIYVDDNLLFQADPDSVISRSTPNYEQQLEKAVEIVNIRPQELTNQYLAGLAKSNNQMEINKLKSALGLK